MFKTFQAVIIATSRRFCTVQEFEMKYGGYKSPKHRDKHIFKTINQWQSKREFIETLQKNILYNTGGLVVVNKPYGTGQSAPTKDNKKAHIPQMSFGDEYFLSDVLPDIASATGHQQLSIIRSPERYSSGVTLLAANESVHQRVKKILLNARAQEKPTSVYWVLSIGNPIHEEGNKKVALKLEKSENNKRQIPIIVSSWTKNESKFAKVKTVRIQHQVLETTDSVSLVEVAPTRTKSHILRLYLSSKLLSPVLGDNICGSRVKMLMGINVIIDHWSDSASAPQKIPIEILKKLNLGAGETSLVPSHIHHRSVLLQNYFGNKKDLELTAPVPEYFRWSCERFGVFIDKHEHKEISFHQAEVR